MIFECRFGEPADELETDPVEDSESEFESEELDDPLDEDESLKSSFFSSSASEEFPLYFFFFFFFL